MRYGIFGDIHGNFDAFQVTLDRLESENVDMMVCLGDVVGYGAEPEQCVEKVVELGCRCLAGNHDHAAIGKIDVEYFNTYAKEAALWTRDRLSVQHKEFLTRLGFAEHFPGFAIVHGSLHGPELFNYIQTIMDAEMSFEALDKPVLFFGHTHIPLAFFDTTPMTYTMEEEFKLDPNVKALVNIGSVGQPRDEDPRSSCAVYDTDSSLVKILRTPYDVETAGRKIIEAGLPEPLAMRLSLGK